MGVAMSDTDKTERFIFGGFFFMIIIALIVDGCTGRDAFAVEFRRAEPTLGDVHAASCRVRVSNARGTGIFNGYNPAANKAYITTNDHVTTTSGSCKLDFWTNAKMETVDGRVLYSLRDDRNARDFALIEVDATALKAIDPPYIPIKPLSLKDLHGRVFMSSGCPDGRFDQGWLGTIERTDGGMAIFSPPPVPGQSGSGICVSIDGRLYDVAKLTYLLGTKGADESKGGALPLINFVNDIDTAAGYSVATMWTKTPVSYLFENDQTTLAVQGEQQQGAALYSFGKDNGVRVQAPGEPEKTIAVYVTDPASYEMQPEPVANRRAPRGILNDLLRDETERETPQEQEQEPQPRKRSEGGNGLLFDRSIVDRIGESVTAAANEIISRLGRTIFWLAVVAAALGTFLARFVAAAVKCSGKWLRAFVEALKEVSKDTKDNEQKHSGDYMGD